MLIKKNFSLKKLNTFGINTYARYFTVIKNIDDIQEIFSLYNPPKYSRIILLGNGSNILFLKKYYNRLVLKIQLKGIKIIHENKYQVIVQAFSGENWNDFVEWTIQNKLTGLENLSFIPGTVGASPIQNIGAYGTEVKNFILKVQVYEIISQKIIEFNCKKCNFSYRNSFFKKNSQKFLVISVFFLLKKEKYQKLNLSYKNIQQGLNNLNINNPTIQDLRKLIFSIRKNKIPNPNKIGNAGSFFKNPIVSNFFFKKLKNDYPDIVGYPISNNFIKISANYLIEHVGWKGKKIGYVGIYEKQPIILLNFGKASGMDIYSVSEKIIEDIKNKFNIQLLREVELF